MDDLVVPLLQETTIWNPDENHPKVNMFVTGSHQAVTYSRLHTSNHIPAVHGLSPPFFADEPMNHPGTSRLSHCNCWRPEPGLLPDFATSSLLGSPRNSLALLLLWKIKLSAGLHPFHFDGWTWGHQPLRWHQTWHPQTTAGRVWNLMRKNIVRATSGPDLQHDCNGWHFGSKSSPLPRISCAVFGKSVS